MVALTAKQRALSGFYLGLLLIAVSLYLLNAKAFVIYAIASCIFLFGFKLFGGICGALLHLSGDQYRSTFMDSPHLTALSAVVFVFVGIALGVMISSLAGPAIAVSLSMFFLDQSIDVKFSQN